MPLVGARIGDTIVVEHRPSQLELDPQRRGVAERPPLGRRRRARPGVAEVHRLQRLDVAMIRLGGPRSGRSAPLRAAQVLRRLTDLPVAVGRARPRSPPRRQARRTERARARRDAGPPADRRSRRGSPAVPARRRSRRARRRPTRARARRRHAVASSISRASTASLDRTVLAARPCRLLDDGRVGVGEHREQVDARPCRRRARPLAGGRPGRRRAAHG